MAGFNASDKVLLLQHGCADLLQLAQRRGAQLHKLLSGTGIFEQDLHKPHARIHHADWLTLLHNCQQQVNSTELPYLLGAALLQNRYIAVSQSLSHADNLLQALRQLYYFRHQLFPAVYPVLYRQQQELIIEFKPGLGMASQWRNQCAVVIALLTTLVKQQLGSTAQLSVQLQQTADPHTALFLGAKVQFAQPCDAIRIALPACYQRFNDADRRKFNAARRTCRQLNHVLPKRRGLLEQIYKLQRRALPHLLSLEQVATELGLSASTLKRQLQHQHSGFAQLIDQIRGDTARRLLLQGGYSNRQLALKLGYSDEHNFRRAFKRWTGQLPSQVKDQLKSLLNLA